MANPGKKKKKCERYKQLGIREINKQKKQEKNNKRIAKFAKRRADGKRNASETSHKPIGTQKEPSGTNVFIKGEETFGQFDYPLSRYISIMRRLQNQLDAEIKAFKRSFVVGE